MKIDSALQAFSEKYTRDAIQSIENISKDFGLNYKKSTIKGFNIQEGFDDFSDFLTNYGKYKIENKDNENATPQNLICESVKTNIEKEVFKEGQLLYKDLPLFVESYIIGIKKITETADKVKQSMFESGVSPDAIGNVNDFVDQFMDVLHESFDPTMDRILWASGYNANVRLAPKPKDTSKNTKAVFL